MPATLTPHKDDSTILVLRLTNPWKWAQIQQAEQDLAKTMTIDPTTRIDRIVDLLDSPSLPHASLSAAYRHVKAFNASWGLSVGVTTDPDILRMIATFKRIFPAFSQHIYTASSIDEAISIIQEHRKTGQSFD